MRQLAGGIGMRLGPTWGVVFAAVIAGCTAQKPVVDYGMAAGRGGYVPARIAVLSCRQWPKEAIFREVGKNPPNTEGLRQLCQAFDQFVLTGFREQPYMKGFSPSAVAKLLAAAYPDRAILDELEASWHHLSSDCSTCVNFPSFYQDSIAPRADWRRWLNTISEGTKNSDAVLIPFVLQASQTQRNDRGMLVSEIAAAIGLLLVDTNNGAVLWSGERSSQFATSLLSETAAGKYPPYPAWTALAERLFVESVWKEFPGRIVL